MLCSWQGVFRLRLIPEEDLGSRRRTEVKLCLADKTVMWICCCLTPRVSGFKICLSICSSTSVCSGLPCLIVIWGLHLKVHWAPLKNAPELCRCLFQLPEERQRPCWSYPRRSCIHKGFLRTVALSWGNQVLPLLLLCLRLIWVSSSAQEWGTTVCDGGRWLKRDQGPQLPKIFLSQRIGKFLVIRGKHTRFLGGAKC